MGERSIDRFTQSALSHSSLSLPPAQSVFTFLYITLLSHMGERLAVRLRTALFQSLVEQDIAFFDSHKSGELVSRYNRRGDKGTLQLWKPVHPLLPLSSLLTPSFLFSPISAFSLPLIFPNFLSSLLSPLPFFHPSIYFFPPIPISDCQVTFRTSRVPSRWPLARVFAPSRRPSAVSSPSTSSLLR